VPVDELEFSRSLPHHINKLLVDRLQRIILQGFDPSDELLATESEINGIIE